MRNNNHIKVGLALGSGAARGLTHIGALKAIEEKGIKISYISGTSEKMQYFIKHPQHLLSSGKTIETTNPKFWSTLYHMYIIVQVQIDDLNMQHAKPDILIEPDAGDFKIFEFSKAKELIEIGYLTAKEKLDSIDFV